MKKNLIVALGLASAVLVACTDKTTPNTIFGITYQAPLNEESTDIQLGFTTIPNGVQTTGQDNPTQGQLTVTLTNNFNCSAFSVAENGERGQEIFTSGTVPSYISEGYDQSSDFARGSVVMIICDGFADDNPDNPYHTNYQVSATFAGHTYTDSGYFEWHDSDS